MATRVIYNDVVLHNVLIREFRQEVVYDASRTDSLFSRYTITVEGLITDYSAGAHVGDRYGSRRRTNDWLRTVRIALSEPRRPLRIEQVEWLQGDERAETILWCDPSDYSPSNPSRDLSNGPKPTDLQVKAFLGTQAIRVVWTVQCDLLQPPLNGGELRFLDGYHEPQPVLDNRWSVAEEFDENLFCTRTISGSLRMSVAAAKTGFDYRWLATPGLEAGFKRQRMRYAVQPDGLEVQYEIQDRQWHTMPPWPCTDMRIRHQRSTNYGVTAVAVCDVQLAGPPYAPKIALLTRLAQIMDFYLGILRRADSYGKTWRIRHADIVEEVGPENRVSGRIEIDLIGPPEGNGAAEQSNEFLTRHMLNIGRDLDLRRQPDPIVPLHQSPGPYAPTIAEMPSPFGYNTWGGERNPAAIALFQCYLQRPYRPPHGMANWPSPQPEADKEDHKKPAKVERVPVEQLYPDRSDHYSDEHKQHLYTYVRMKNAYRIDRMKVGCPQVVSNPGQSDSGGASPSQRKAKTTHVVHLAQGTVRRTVAFDAERLGAWPELPQPIDYELPGGNKAVLVKYQIAPFPPTTSATGEGLIYRVQGRYQWILEEPLDDDAAWPLGHLPHVDDQTEGFLPSFAERIGPKS